MGRDDRTEGRGRTPTPLPLRLDEVKSLLPEFEVLHEMGSPIGRRWLAKRAGRSCLVEFRVLDADLLCREAFHAEMTSLARLRHPALARIDDWGSRGPICYTVLEAIDGLDLRQRRMAGPLPPAEVVHLVTGLSAGLARIHAMGFAHRAIRPENVIISNAATKLVGYFTGPRSRDQPGPSAYFAPEHGAAPRATPAADVWALGVLALELVRGVPSQDPNADLDALPEELRILRRALRPAGDDRPSAEDIRAALEGR